MKTRICDLLGIKYPIIQGGMAWVATAELAGAISNAGGLGLIAAGNAPADWVREQIKKAREITSNNFGVNIMLLSPFVDEVMNVVYEERVPVITTGAGNPGKYIGKLKSAGIRVVPVVPSVALAKKMERSGVDAVIAEGTEAGGHIGELTTMVLLPQVSDAISIPVIAAGGIADSRGVIAAFALGAEGVQIGTRFICSKECTVHEDYKGAIIKASDRDAVVTGRSTGHPVRLLKNKLTREYDNLENQKASLEEIEEFGRGRLQAAVCDGDIEFGSVMAGQISGMINDLKPCKEIIEEIVSGTSSIIERLSMYLGGN